MRTTPQPVKREGGAFHTDAERLEWYANMNALETAFAAKGINSTDITPEAAVRWRTTGKINPPKKGDKQ